MLRIFAVKDLDARKKMLLLESDIHRQTLQVQIAAAQESAAHLKKRFALIGISSVALSAGASVAGLLMAKGRSSEKSGIVSKVISGFSLFNQVKAFMKRIRNPGGDAE